jgi:hypothetical protein
MARGPMASLSSSTTFTQTFMTGWLLLLVTVPEM